MPGTVPEKNRNQVKVQTWELGGVLASYCSHTDSSEYQGTVTSHFIHRQIHRKSKYICATYPRLCALIELLIRPIRKGQFAALFSTLSTLASSHKICSYTKEFLIMQVISLGSSRNVNIKKLGHDMQRGAHLSFQGCFVEPFLASQYN